MAGTLAESLKKPVPLSGLVGLIAADLLFLFSVEFMRRRFFHTFIVLHVISVIAFFAAVSTPKIPPLEPKYS